MRKSLLRNLIIAGTISFFAPNFSGAQDPIPQNFNRARQIIQQNPNDYNHISVSGKDFSVKPIDRGIVYQTGDTSVTLTVTPKYSFYDVYNASLGIKIEDDLVKSCAKTWAGILSEEIMKREIEQGRLREEKEKRLMEEQKAKITERAKTDLAVPLEK